MLYLTTVVKRRLPELENRQVISRPGEHSLTGTQPDYAEESEKKKKIM